MNLREEYDYHSWIHFAGCAGIAIGLYLIGIVWFGALILALFAGILWETADEIYSDKVKYHVSNPQSFWGKVVFDPRGFSWLDIIFDAAGVTTGALIILLI